MNALKALVVGMGLLIVVGMVALGYGLYYKANHPDFKLFSSAPAPSTGAGGPPTPSVAPAPERSVSFGEVNLALPPDGKVERITAEGNRLFVQVSGSGSGDERIVVIDLVKGTILGTVYLRR